MEQQIEKVVRLDGDEEKLVMLREAQKLVLLSSSKLVQRREDLGFVIDLSALVWARCPVAKESTGCYSTEAAAANRWEKKKIGCRKKMMLWRIL